MDEVQGKQVNTKNEWQNFRPWPGSGVQSLTAHTQGRAESQEETARKGICKASLNETAVTATAIHF